MKLSNVGHGILLTAEIAAIVAIVVTRCDFRRPPKSAEARMESFDAAVVSFDADGGACLDNCRVVRRGETYGETMNLYPSEDDRYFPNSHNVSHAFWSQDLTADGRCKGNVEFLNYITANVVPSISKGFRWTYVVDVESLEGDFTGWDVGDSHPSAKARLSHGRISPGVKSGDKRFLTLLGQDPKDCTLLDCAYIYLKPGQHLKAKFRVSLFAGTEINASNCHYVKPGETLACTLPVPRAQATPSSAGMTAIGRSWPTPR